MNTRDYDYIEARLLAPCEGAAEAAGRLRNPSSAGSVPRPDLADRLNEAMKVFIDECRAVRRQLGHPVP